MKDFDTVYEEKADILRLQNRGELGWLWHQFHTRVRDMRMASYLEIGARRGGSFWALTQAMPRGSSALAVDLPGARWGDAESDSYLMDTCAGLVDRGYDAQVMLVDSHHVSTQIAVERMMVLPAFDLIMVDGDHTQEGVALDFQMYRRYLAPGGLMAFHDLYVKDFGVSSAWHSTIMPWALRHGWTVSMTRDCGEPRLGFGVVEKPR